MATTPRNGSPSTARKDELARAPANDAGTITIKTERAAEMRAALQEEREIREIVREYISQQMVETVDYGPMPGVKQKQARPGEKTERVKMVLFKEGAEKLFDIFKCRPEYDYINVERDHDKGLYYYEVRCRAIHRDTDREINQGLGSASSYESKYRYRSGDRLCPECSAPAIIKGKAEYGGGYICFAKKGGCGAKFPDGAPEIEGQQSGKVQNPDLADVANTVLKIAKKRAQVDAAIGLARVSDLFTQDLEDLPVLQTEADVRKQDDAKALYARLHDVMAKDAVMPFVEKVLGHKLKGRFSEMNPRDLARITKALDDAQPQAGAAEVAQTLASAKQANGDDLSDAEREELARLGGGTDGETA